MLQFGARRRPRRPSLTPMIDVVFLLLVFFMLAARFGVDAVLPLTLAGTSGEARYEGPPRVVDVLPEDLRLNGAAIPEATLSDALSALMQTPDDVIVVRAADGAVLQRVVDTMRALRTAGFGVFVLVE
ncbi:MAG: biopolymer transporter ExbD [Pseudomonadota bacterium]